MRQIPRSISVAAFLIVSTIAGSTAAQRVYLNPSDQTSNPVSGGGNEAQYALINANLARPILEQAGFTVRVDQDFYNAPSNANSWGADVFVSVHSNAGGGHGIETLYVSGGGQTLAGHVQDGLLSKVPYQDRGLKYRDNLHVLNSTNMKACLTEVLFHDCSAGSGYQGHPPSESAYLRSAEGQKSIASGIAAGVCAHFGASCGSAAAPTVGNFMGVVYRAPNMDDRLAGAVVQIEGGPSITTGPDGDFAFELEPGAYTASATFEGFTPGTSTRDVVAGQDVWGSIGLEPTAPPEDAGADRELLDVTPSDERTPDAFYAEAATGDAEPDGDTAPVIWASEEASGCACALGRTGSRGEAWLLAVAAGMLGWLRRRTQSPARSDANRPESSKNHLRR